MQHLKAEVLSNEKVAPGIHLLKLYSDRITSSALPGQFVHVKCGENRDYILRRPFSIHRLLGEGTFELLFQVVGRGTRYLSKKHPRSFLSMIGPLGGGFVSYPNLSVGVVVAGGLGIAPLLFLIDELLKKHVKLYVLLGAETRERLLYVVDLKRMARKVSCATDDGSFGYRGAVTDLLPQMIEEAEPEQVFACGPYQMLKRVSEICKLEEVPCQVSLESQMGCGLGVCLSCACKVKKDNDYIFKQVCTHGPVFNADEIYWEDT